VIIDSSAVLAILFAEEDAPALAQAIEAAEARRMSAANWLEIAIRVDQGVAAALCEYDLDLKATAVHFFRPTKSLKRLGVP
jgi:uncharacterized protein with PIN domain